MLRCERYVDGCNQVTVVTCWTVAQIISVHVRRYPSSICRVHRPDASSWASAICLAWHLPAGLGTDKITV